MIPYFPKTAAPAPLEVEWSVTVVTGCLAITFSRMSRAFSDSEDDESEE